MRIHPEGYKILSIWLLLLGVILFCIFQFYALLPAFIWGVCGVILFVLTFFLVYFFRNPIRNAPQNDKWILAPADGKVVVMEETLEKEFLQEKRIQISIFMSPLNVHSNRNPVSGMVVYYQYHPGSYLVAWHPKSSTENERNTIVVKLENGHQILFRQIAGAMARRIKCYLREGSKVKQGEEFGFIKFGSRVYIFLPLDASIKVRIGDKTIGGQTVLATLS